MDLIIRFSEKGAQVLVPKDMKAQDMVLASFLITREVNKAFDVAEFQQAQLDQTIQRVSAIPSGLKSV
jgi:predicted cupin superfamily sugar epimerase